MKLQVTGEKEEEVKSRESSWDSKASPCRTVVAVPRVGVDWKLGTIVEAV
jgi:hypothetical protein